MEKIIYLDNAATTRTAPEVLDAMIPYFTEKYGNPSTVYSIGSQNKDVITKQREIIAEALGAQSNEIYFTAGGSESDNWVLKATADAYAGKGNHIITTKIEHHAILHSCEYLEKKGIEVTYVGVDENGVVTALKEGTATIKVSNVAGLEATCKVTVKGKAEQPDVDKEAPTAPGKLSKAEVTKESIQIRWKNSKDNVGVEGYEIFLNGVSIKKVSADTTSVMISNLLAGTEYQITVKAYDAAGNYSEAAALTVKTLAEDKNNSGNKDDNQKPDSGNKNDGQKPSGDQNQNSSADKKPAGVPQVTVVKTGDSGAPIGIFVVLAIVAAGAVVVVVLRMKADQKKNAKKKHRNRPDGTR